MSKHFRRHVLKSQCWFWSNFNSRDVFKTRQTSMMEHFCKNSSMTTPKGLTRLVFTAKTFRSLQKIFEYGPDWSLTYNRFHNKLRVFDILLIFLFSTSEKVGDYYCKHSIYKLPQELPNDLLGNIRKVLKLHRKIAYWSAFPGKWKLCLY